MIAVLPIARSRAGLAIFLVLGLVLIVLIMAGTWFFVLSGEARGTNSYAKRVIATTTGEGVAAQISAQINRMAWKDRFYARVGNPDLTGFSYYFTENDFPFQRAEFKPLGAFGRTTWTGIQTPTFEGVVSDLPATKSYRIKLKIEFDETEIFMTWDKTWSETFLGSLNASNDEVVTDTIPLGLSEVDQLIDDVKETARANRGGADAATLAELDRLITALNSGEGQDILLVP